MRVTWGRGIDDCTHIPRFLLSSCCCWYKKVYIRFAVGISTKALCSFFMASTTILGLFLLFSLGGVVAEGLSNDPNFNYNYAVTFGGDHVVSLDQGREIQLTMDKSTGSGFGSKFDYGSGFFYMKIKLPDKDTAGVVTSFYLSSHKRRHDEVDFEFLGNREGKPYTLQTNIFANGQGNREQRIRLWFDPTLNFHTYKILWNPYQLVFFVDNIPIRVFANKTNIGVGYPSKPMQVLASLWDAEDWATDGGQAKTNWTCAPFKANFQGFNVDGCKSYDPNISPCYSSSLWWNSAEHMRLSPAQQILYEYVKKRYITYDYCSDKPRFPTPPPECPQ
ncbi:xyloglucan endotransglucosylase/hydrolase protein 2-like [Magnolia sinica]|uniref:xyloglucan endotransglucosylase/hydrolase protein 2-like n=1 Tax=Magnolia sinica TaxID=86752 RepID=UPI00265976ED|nr:xyloglucan endotransglucosylase/hydrolase protein 2-like [Magnolia sinica]